MKRVLLKIICLMTAMVVIMPACSAWAIANYGGYAYYLNSTLNSSREAIIKSTYLDLPEEYTFPEVLNGYNVAAIDEFEIKGEDNVRIINIPDSVRILGYNALTRFDNLEVLNIGSGVERISGFLDCKLSKYVFEGFGYSSTDSSGTGYLPTYIPALEADTLKSINVSEDNQVFSSVDGLLLSKSGDVLLQIPGATTGVFEVPDYVTSVDSSKAFYGCDKITELYFHDNFSLDSMHLYMKGLEKIHFGEKMSFTPNFVKDCQALKEIKFSANSEYTSLNGMAYSKDITKFICCPPGRQGEIVLSGKTKVVGSGAFSNCKNVTNIVMPEGLQKIESYAFDHCTGLECIKVPNTVTEIGNKAFVYCDNVRDLYIPASVTSIGESLFSIFPEIGNKSDVTIHSPLNSAAHAYALANGYGWEITDVITGEVARDSINVTVNGLVKPGQLFAVVYAGKNLIEDVLPAQSISSDGEYTFDMSEVDGGRFVKVFLWDSVESMSPICDSIEIELE